MRVHLRSLFISLALLTLPLLAQDWVNPDFPDLPDYPFYSFIGCVEDPDGYTNLRAGKGTEHEIRRRLYPEANFLVRAQHGEDWWFIVTSDGQVGYVHRSRIREVHPDGDLSFEVQDVDGETNLRAGPGTDSQVLGTVKSGETVFTLPSQANLGPDARQVLSETEWHKVMTGDGRVGYIHKSRLRWVLKQ